MAFRISSASKPGRAARGAALAVLALAVAVVGVRLLDRPAPDAAAPAARPADATGEVEAPAHGAPSLRSPDAQASPALHPPPLADELRDVQRALEGGVSPQDSLKAALVLMGCKGADGAVETLYRMRDQAEPAWKALQQLPGVRMDELIVRTQDSQRRCQAFDAPTMARTGELFARAYRGGAEDAAIHYLQWLIGEGKLTVNPELTGKLQREARQAAEDGDLQALTVFSHAFDPAAHGIAEAQRRGFKEAWFRIQGELSGSALEQASRDAMERTEKMMSHRAYVSRPLSAEQQREADNLTEKVLAAWRKRWPAQRSAA